MKTKALKTLLMAACAFGMVATSAQAQDAIKVGVLQPLSGGAGPYGTRVSQAIRAMASLINEDGGVLGRKIEIIVRDDENTPAVAVAKANELIGENVAVILEGWGSASALAVQPVISRSGILDITAVSKSADLVNGKVNPLPVKMNTTSDQDAPVIAEHIAKGSKRLAYLLENGPYSDQIVDSLAAELKRLGWKGEVVATERFPFAQTDFRVALTKIADSKADMVMVQNSNQGSGLVSLLRQYKQMRVPAQFVAASGVIVQSVIDAVGADAEGLISADFYLPESEPFLSIPENKRFVARLKEQFNVEPDKYMALGAAGLQVWAQAANKTKSLKKEDVAKAIHGNSFRTVLGESKFLQNGQQDVKSYLFTAKGGKIVVVN